MLHPFHQRFGRAQMFELKLRGATVTQEIQPAARVGADRKSGYRPRPKSVT